MEIDHDVPSRMLRFYAALEYASEEMLVAARAGDWDAVCRLEGACSVIIARLRALSSGETMRGNEQGERMRILRGILANDAEIRRIAQPLPAFLDVPAHAGLMAMSSTALH
jgi:flagellar protein FliT